MTGSASPDRFSSPVPPHEMLGSLLQKTPPFWGEALPSDQSFGLSFLDEVSAKASESHFSVVDLGDSFVLGFSVNSSFSGEGSREAPPSFKEVSGPTSELPIN